MRRCSKSPSAYCCFINLCSNNLMADHALPTLRQRVFRAGRWSFAGYGLSQAIRLGSNLVMTRLLAPEMFGVMAISIMVTVILGMLSDIGLQQSIVQSPHGDDPAFLDTAWVVQIVRGGILWLIALLLSIALYVANLHGMFPAQSVYASAILPPVIAVSSFAAVISGFASTKIATAYRKFNQQRIVQIEVISQLAALTVMIGIGIATRSIWALVAGGLVATATSTALSHLWISGSQNRFRSEKKSMQELIHFGKWIFLSSAVGILAINGDRILLGGYVDAHTLGLYAIAILIVGSIEGLLSRLFATVSLPTLSEVARENPARLREIYYRLRIPGDLVLLFLAGLLFTAGHLAVDVLYDSRYSAAGGMLEILALSLITVRYGVAHQIYLAVGVPRYLALINAVRFMSLFTLVPALYYVAGMQAAIWGIALHGLATVPLVYYFNEKLELNDFRNESKVLIAFPVGILCGTALNQVLG
jgi:O-antigen/teichoic acid export membrane protein